MKKYVKPTIDVVELSVKENMAALPAGISKTVVAGDSTGTTENGVPLTVYNLTAVTTSAEA
ncbi:MAG: hypothetical protein II998_06275 [Clostridia bacterium]|nr:hypothetical protein [Clostridia bacterium]